MSDRVHDDEPDTSEGVVRQLLTAECPQWSACPIEYLATSGTDNAMWRVRLAAEQDVVVRLPRRPGAAANVRREVEVLETIRRTSVGSLVSTPSVCHVGERHECFPHHWSVLEWIPGADAWTAGAGLGAADRAELATDVAQVVVAIGEVTDVDAVRRVPGSRGGPLRPLIERLHGWLDDPQWNARDLLDVGAVRRLAVEAEDVVDEPVQQSFVHGDLIPGNLLLDRGRLAAVIDWGGAGVGDAAQDLAPAWAVFDEPERASFRAGVGSDEAAWVRGRTFELEHAVGGVLYYVPRRHPLGDVMLRTLQRILAG